MAPLSSPALLQTLVDIFFLFDGTHEDSDLLWHPNRSRVRALDPRAVLYGYERTTVDGLALREQVRLYAISSLFGHQPLQGSRLFASLIANDYLVSEDKQ